MKQFNVYSLMWTFLYSYYANDAQGFINEGDFQLGIINNARVYVKYMGNAPKEKQL